MMTRAEHLEFCKRRAMEYIEHNDPQGAVTSMLSDLQKHPETEGLVQSLGMMGIHVAAGGNVAEARRFIQGFN